MLHHILQEIRKIIFQMTNRDDEQLNGLKLHLILTKSNKIVQYNLEEIIKQNYQSVQDFLEDCHEKYLKNIKNAIKTTELKKTIDHLKGVMHKLNPKFPDIRPGKKKLPFPTSLQHFDINECYQIARNFLKISNLEDYEKLIQIRNKVYHTKVAQITDEMFREFVAEVEKITENFSKDSGFKDEIQRINGVDMLFFSKFSRLESSIPYRNIEDLVENLDLENLEYSLIQSRLVVLHGPPRVGKTTNALYFAQKKSRQTLEWNVQWFRAETKETFMNDLQELNKLINPSYEEQSFADVIFLLQNGLKKSQEETKNFLFVFDNLIEDKNENWIENFLKSMPDNVFALITSRDADFLIKSDTTEKQVVEVNYFTKEQAKNFFNKRISPDRKFTESEQNLLESRFNEGRPDYLNSLVDKLNESELLSVVDADNSLMEIQTAQTFK